MKIIDLSQPISEDMYIWPGDPETELTIVQTIEKNTWRVCYLQMATHSGTHVNVPAHMVLGGKTLDDYPPEVFMGKAVVINLNDEYPPKTGLIFPTGNLDTTYVDKIMAAEPPFIGVGEKCEFDVETERRLLELGLISFENLTNLDQFPAGKAIQFIGLPLKIKLGDGSPVRAVAVVE